MTIKDRLDPDHDSENDNLVKVPINVIILDENDNSPTFQNVRKFFFSIISLERYGIGVVASCRD